jgi:hypothetical protein
MVSEVEVSEHRASSATAKERKKSELILSFAPRNNETIDELLNTSPRGRRF